MSLVYGNNFAGFPQSTQQQQDTSYQTDAFYDDLSRQRAAAAAASSASRRRLSRSSVSSRTPGTVMRVSKPTSANNSPRTAAVKQARRRTLMNDSGLFLTRTSPPATEGMAASAQTTTATASYMPTPDMSIPQQQFSSRLRPADAARPARPMSWHPGSTHMIPNHLSLNTQFQGGAFAMPNDMEAFPTMQPYALSPAAYSSQTSPSVTFSPYQAAYEPMAANTYYYSPNPWAAVSPTVNANGAMFDKLPSPVDCPALLAEQQQQQQQQAAVSQMQHDQCQQAMYPHVNEQQFQHQQVMDTAIHHQTTSDSTANWNSFVAHGFDQQTAPPTPPDNCYSATSETAPARMIQNEDNIAYQPLEEDEPEGEILIGMGLYDPPEKDVVDTTLQSYRATFANMLGAACYPEPTGKGLKLEDAWEPPENVDDDDDDDDRDAEGEEQ